MSIVIIVIMTIIIILLLLILLYYATNSQPTGQRRQLFKLTTQTFRLILSLLKERPNILPSFILFPLPKPSPNSATELYMPQNRNPG